MRYLIISILSLFIPLTSFAVKLNQRGEKMVSEIRVDYADSSAFPSYVIKLGYDNMGEINSLVFERQSIEYELAKLHRDKDGNMTREDYFDNKKTDFYKIKVDSCKRPTEMVRYEKNIHGKFIKVGTFYYNYNFQDYALSIVHRDAGDEPDLRESVKMIDNNAYIFYNVINPTNGKESKHTARDKNVSYSSYDNDLNVDISQIIRGTSNVGGCFLNLEVDSSLFILTQWIPVKSRKMLSTIQLEKMKYNFNGDILESVDVLYSRTNELNYTISLSYLE